MSGKNYKDEKRKQQDLQADLTKKEIERMDLDKDLKKAEIGLAAEEAEVVNVRAEKDKLHEKNIAQIDQIAAFQNKCIERDDAFGSGPVSTGPGRKRRIKLLPPVMTSSIIANRKSVTSLEM